MRSAPSSAAPAHDGRVVIIGKLTLFATDTGGAWLIDRDDRLALRLARPDPVDARRATRLPFGYPYALSEPTLMAT